MNLNGAGEWARTIDLLITNQLLYQLSYAGLGCAPVKGLNRILRRREEQCGRSEPAYQLPYQPKNVTTFGVGCPCPNIWTNPACGPTVVCRFGAGSRFRAKELKRPHDANMPPLQRDEVRRG